MDKPWLKHYEPHVPEHIDFPQTLLSEVLKQRADKFGSRTAMIFKGGKLSFRQFDDAVDRFAAALQKLGVKKGDRVALWLPNCPQFAIAYYATLRIGDVVAPCNPLYQAPEMIHQLNDSGAQVIVALSSLYPLLKQFHGETEIRHTIVAQIKTYFPPHLRLLFGLLLEKKTGHRADISGHPNTYWFHDLIKSAPLTPQPVEVRPEDTAVLMYTGGTTGISKGAELTHSNIFKNAYQCKVWLNAGEAQDVDMVQMPLFHSYGMTTGMNLCVVVAGTMLLVPDPRALEDVIQTIHKFKPTLYPGSPAIYTSIINYSHIAKYDLKSIRLCISGASGLPVEVQERFQNLTGARLVEGYGLSEASPVTHANPLFGENRIGTIGLPWPDTEVKIVDADTGTKTMGIGEEGELCVRGPQVMKGYWNMPAETANVLRQAPDDPDGKPWLYTGDIATMDADGYFRIVDRKKDIIVSGGGYKIFPREVEEVLYTHPKIMEVAVTGVPYGEKGERVKAFVVLKPGEELLADDIVEFCRQRLAPYKVPKFVEFRDSIPKTIAGKPLRRQLRQESIQAARAAEQPPAGEEKAKVTA
ncbi:MAG: long-chain-fatty-acid--CoA ligase [Rudaea sp.]